VVYPTTATVTPNILKVPTGTNVTLKALIDGMHNPAPTGTVTFQGIDLPVSGSVSYTTVTDSSGFPALQAALTFAANSSNRIFAVYGGDSNYASSDSQPATITVGTPNFSPSTTPPSAT